MPYDTRLNELNSRYTDLIGKISFEEASCIRNALTAYNAARSDKLPTLVLYVTSTTDIPIGDSFQPRIKETREALDGILKDMYKSITDQSKLSSAALAFQGTARMEDDRFFGGLAGLGLEKARDKILEVQASLLTYIAVLDTKWSSTLDKNAPIEQQEEQLTRELNDLAKTTIDQGNSISSKWVPAATDTIDQILTFYKDLNTSAKQMIADYLQKYGDKSVNSKDDSEMWAAFFVSVLDPATWVKGILTPKLDSNLNTLLEFLLGQIRLSLPLINGYFGERIGKIRDLVSSQGTVMVIFSDGRKDADEFVRTHGLNLAMEAFGRMSSALDSWVSNQVGANQSDAAAIKTDAVNRTKDRVDKLNNAFIEFVRNNDGKFFGSVSNSVQQAFINSAFWDDSQRQAESWGLEARLRFYNDNLNKFYPDLKNAFAQLGNAVAGLPLPLQARYMDAALEIQNRFLETVGAKVEEAKSSTEQAASAVRESEVKQVIDRRPLLALIR